MDLLPLLGNIAIIVVVIWGISVLLKIKPLPEPLGTVVYVLLTVLAVIWIVNAFIGFAPGYRLFYTH